MSSAVLAGDDAALVASQAAAALVAVSGRADLELPARQLWQAERLHGHGCLPLAELDLPADLHTPETLAAASHGWLHLEAGLVYIARHWHAERRLAAGLRARGVVAGPQPSAAELDALGLTDAAQRAAVAVGASHGLTVLTGGPGTGKTWTAARIVAAALYRTPGLRVAAVAPTGKAASRLAASLQAAAHDASLPATARAALAATAAGATTIHRLLGWQPGRGRLRHGPESSLSVDLLLLDEASMADLALWDAVVAALPPTARLVALGDPYQLASVETGAVLEELVSALAGQPSLQALQRSRRFDDRSGVGRLAAILRRSLSGAPATGAELLAALDGRDAGISRHDDLDTALAPVIEHWRAIAASPDAATALQHLAQAVVLTALRHGPRGASGLNRRLAHALGHGDGPERGAAVLITANHPGVGVANGDLGLWWPGADGGLEACFADGRRVPAARLTDHEPGWALTVHKSQGSEWPCVCLVLPDEDLPLLGGELLYTAATRAGQRLLIHGAPGLLLAAAGRRLRRHGGLARRLRQD
jgi:exodeoxyribonuclease V alpha subunit